jgi:membrane protein YdbS with pleckstrin-like domain
MFARLSVVPYGRMQFIDGPPGCSSAFGLATVRLYTAARPRTRVSPDWREEAVACASLAELRGAGGGL